jgi:hypothetical protein
MGAINDAFGKKVQVVVIKDNKLHDAENVPVARPVHGHSQ